MSGQAYASYADVKQRLDEIVEAVSDNDLALDAALALYEEAVKLGLVASNLIEQDAREHADAQDGSAADVQGDDEAERIEMASAQADPNAGEGVHGVAESASATDM